MRRFGFFVHPLDMRDVVRIAPQSKGKRLPLVEKILEWTPAHEVAYIQGLKCADGEDAEGWFIGIPLLPKQITGLPKEFVLKRLYEGALLAKERGAQILGLGGYTSVIGKGGIELAEMLPELPMTSGNSCTTAAAIDATARAAERIGIDLASAKVAVVGGSGSIGAVCAKVFAANEQAAEITLIARNQIRLEKVANEIHEETGKTVLTNNSVQDGIKDADIIISATSSSGDIIKAEYIKSGALICDVSLPHDVCRDVATKRPDVLVIEGGLMQVPEGVDLNYDFGFDPGIALACMAETMTLCMEGRFETYSIGRGLQLEKVREIYSMAKRQGFSLAGFRSFERLVTDEMIEKVIKAKNTAEVQE
ncbi:MAG: shikimate dehydrogenase [bacterium]|nr:shikimate dehydrogenase [bacterium]